MQNRVLVTGATGFIGSRLINNLVGSGTKVNAAVRSLSSNFWNNQNITSFTIGSINCETNWQEALTDCRTVIHLAARVHKMTDSSTDPLSLYRHTNTESTVKLARDASKAGVRRFIYLSTIKVYGETTMEISSTGQKPAYQEDIPLQPDDPYGISKAEAEQELRKICADSGMEYVIIRPPLVYGPGVKANFLKLIKLAISGIPLPLGSINNKRSLIALDNLVDLIICCITHPAAADQTFNVADDEELSTPALIRKICKSMGKKDRIFNFPVAIMRFAAKIFGQTETLRRLTDDLVVETRKVKESLQWQPPVSIEKELSLTADWFMSSRH